MHLEAVLARMGGVVDHSAGDGQRPLAGGGVDRHRSERRVANASALDSGDSGHGDEVGGPGEQHPLHGPPGPGEGAIGGGGDRAGVRVAGVGCDQRLR